MIPRGATRQILVDHVAFDEVLDVSTATVERDWVMARAWLFQRLSPKP